MAQPSGTDPFPLPVAATEDDLGATARRDSVLKPGTLVAERYRIVRFIARGGMGEVYEALDQALGSRVALKTLRRGATDAQALERFKREVLLSRRISHPNVCRVFDLGIDRSAEPGELLLFFTMELLDGESLSDRIARQGRLALGEALPIARQLVEALSAAHSAGVVHRDFKSPNVMLVPTPAGLRAVVTDFGLARVESSQGPTATADGALLGTPAYMAPEQVEGKSVNTAADVYALGVVLFEMVTGRLPFTGASAMEVAVRRLKEPPPSPRACVPDLPQVWESTILRCLERAPEARFSEVAQIFSALQLDTPSAATATALSPLPARPERRLRRRWPVPAMAALAVAGITALVARPRPSETSPAPVATTGRSPRVAHLGFRSHLSDAQLGWTGLAVGEAMCGALAGTPDLDLVSLEEVERMRLNLGVGLSERYLPETVERIVAYSGADRLVVGALSSQGNQGLSLEVGLLDRKGGLSWKSSIQGSLADIPGLGERAAAEVRRALGLPEHARQGAARGALPSKPEAVRPYVEGLSSLRRLDLARAKQLLGEVGGLEPTFAGAPAALAPVYMASENYRAGLPLAERALSLGVPPHRKWLYESWVAAATGNWSKAADLARLEFESRPTLDSGLHLVRALMHEGALVEAFGVSDRLRKLPEPDGSDPRIDLWESIVAIAVPDFERSELAGERARASAVKRGARLEGAVAQAYLIAPYLQNRGEFLRARTILEEARLVQAQLGDQENLALTLSTLGYNLASVGLGAQAQDLFGQGLQLAEGQPWGQIDNLVYALHFAQERGVPWRHWLESLRQVADPHVPYHAAALWQAEARDEWARGNLDAALSALSQLSRERGLSGVSGRSARVGGLACLARGDLDGARRWLEVARLALEAENNASGLAVLRCTQAQLALAEGRSTEAGLLAAAAASELEKYGMVPYLAQARIVEAQAALERGDLAAAALAAERAVALSGKHDFSVVAIRASLWHALVLSRRGEIAAASETGSAALKAAKDSELTELRLEARLVGAELDRAAGRSAAFRLELGALEAEARPLGFKRIADRAAGLLR